jgi:hypothetical protein
MCRLPLLVIACLFGCNPPASATRTTAGPTTTTTDGPSPLRSVDLHYSVYLARSDIHITASPDGLLRSVRTESKSWGGNDANPKHERVEIREGRLTPAQVAELSRLFTGWDTLSSTPYGGVPDGGALSIRYGDKTVSGGSGVSQQVEDARTRISDLAASIPIVKP